MDKMEKKETLKRIHAVDLLNCADQVVKVSGWVENYRDLKKIRFIQLKDRTGFIQVTLPQTEVSKEVFDSIQDLTKESVLEIDGLVKKSPQARLGVELIPSKIQIVSKAKAPTPIDMSGKIVSDLSVRLDYRFLDLRNPKSINLFKLRSRVLGFVVDFFENSGFIGINTPKLTSAGVESGAELFKVDYFGKPAYLAQSPQIYKQMMVCSGLEKVYEIGPVFRAEKSHTVRHLTEFTGIDFEQGFIESEQEVMDTVEGLMHFILKHVQEECAEQLIALGLDQKIEVPEKIPRMDMVEVKKLLAENGLKLTAEDDLTPEAEKWLGDYVLKKFNSEFVFVTNYPWAVRPFYHMKPNGDSKGTKSFDLIWKGLEIATGAQREHRYDLLKAQAKEKGLNLDEMKDYSLIFQYGVPAHGGCGLGLDRIMEQLCNLDNIREAILLPRDPERLTP
ncbi:MAG: aspartate--tRNA(Asn) ligase [Candidatus Diapherotrites archaeon]|nr:aspartate--tRNA(Asn) ligase [Candidatus Diapherotrites archaeon]